MIQTTDRPADRLHCCWLPSNNPATCTELWLALLARIAAHMADYNKLTVANLKALLKDRGIPQTGLTRKAQLVERLEQADNETGASASQANGMDTDTPAPPGDNARDGTLRYVEEISTDARSPAALGADESLEAVEPAPDYHSSVQPVEAGPAPGSGAAVAPDDQAQSTASSMTLPAEGSEQPAVAAVSTPSQIPVPSHEVPVATTAETASATQEASTQPSEAPSSSRLNTEEVVEDNRKRKRRSVTPAVVTEEVANKKLRQDEAVSTVHLKEDVATEQEPVVDGAEVKAGDITMGEPNMEGGATAKVLPARTSDDMMKITHTKIVENADSSSTEPHEVEAAAPVVPELYQAPLSRTDVDVDKSDTALQNSKFSRANPEPTQPADETPVDHTEVSPQSPERTRKQSLHPPRDSRYASLFTHSSSSHAASTAPSGPELTGTTPSIHPATRALYIRNFMRPLHPAQLKAHLASLATGDSPASDSDPSPIQLFHLDPIRTHAFVLLSTAAAAARVRVALHDHVWPPERDRKPLWADFVPDEKVQEWIAAETDAASQSARAGGKRWEVVYERDEGGGVVAELREAGAPPGPVSRGRAVLQQDGGARGGAPAGPRRRSPPPPPPTRAPVQQPLKGGDAPAPSFLALDALFRSTAAKPKLYFQPVTKELAEKRQAGLDKCTSRTWKGVRGYGVEELRRYCFEDGDVLVDGGTHFPSRRDKEERGGGYAGFRGRGRGSWRGR